MFCFNVRKRIAEAVNSGGAFTERVVKHMRSCPACRAYMEEQSRIRQKLTVPRDAGEEFPPFLHGRIMNALEVQATPVRHRRLITIASGICVLLTVGIGLFGLQNREVTYSQDWGSFQTLENGATQVGQLVSEGPDVLSQPLDSEMQLLEEDLLIVADRLDDFIDLALSIAPEKNG